MTPLVIEPDARTREATTLLLESWGYRPRAAGSAGEGRVLVQTGEITPTVILACDVDAIASVRAVCPPGVPGLLVCSEPGEALDRRCETLGLRVLVKPVAPDRLRAALAEALATTAPGPSSPRRSPGSSGNTHGT